MLQNADDHFFPLLVKYDFGQLSSTVTIKEPFFGRCRSRYKAFVVCDITILKNCNQQSRQKLEIGPPTP